MTRAEHLAWAKSRAMEELESNGIVEALVSLASDLNKHDETRGHIGIALGMAQLRGGFIKTQDEMRHFIEGFN